MAGATPTDPPIEYSIKFKITEDDVIRKKLLEDRYGKLVDVNLELLQKIIGGISAGGFDGSGFISTPNMIKDNIVLKVVNNGRLRNNEKISIRILGAYGYTPTDPFLILQAKADRFRVAITSTTFDDVAYLKTVKQLGTNGKGSLLLPRHEGVNIQAIPNENLKVGDVVMLHLTPKTGYDLALNPHIPYLVTDT